MRVVHVVPRDLARGAQVFADRLVARANAERGDQEHVALVLFDGPVVALPRARRLGVPQRARTPLGIHPVLTRRLHRALDDLDPAVVVAHGAEALKYLQTTRRPVVGHAIGVSTPAGRKGPRRALYRALYRRTAAMVAVSDDVAEELAADFAVPGHRLSVIRNGRDPDVPVADLRQRTRPRLVFVGHLTASKRPGLFVDVVAELRARGVGLDAGLIGDGDLAEALAGPARAAGVELLGRRDDVPARLAGGDVFCFPSLAAGEGLPGVLIEAALAGLPIVATEVPGARDVIVPDRTGAILPNTVDPAGRSLVAPLADRLEELLRDRDLRIAQGTAARERAVTELDLDSAVRQWQRLLDTVGTRGTDSTAGR